MLLIFACNFKCVKFYLAPLIIGHLGAVILVDQEQVANFEKSAHSIAKLDQHLQLKMFLHTMFTVERTEGG